MVYAGYKYIGARDDPQRVGNARAILVNTMIACAVAVGGFSLVNLTLSALTSSPGAIQIKNLLEAPDSELIPPRPSYHNWNGGYLLTLTFDQEVCYNAQELDHISLGTSAGRMPLQDNHGTNNNKANCVDGDPNRNRNEIEFNIREAVGAGRATFNALVFEYGSSIVSTETNMAVSTRFKSFAMVYNVRN